MVHENAHLEYMDIFHKPSEVQNLRKCPSEVYGFYLKYMVYEKVHLKFMVYENVHLKYMVWNVQSEVRGL